MYKYVLFDLDDTILDFKKSELEAIRLILKDYYLDSPFMVDRFQIINEEEFINFQKGIHKTRKEFHIERFRRLFEIFSIPNLNYEQINELYLKYLGEIVFVKENAPFVLEELSKKYDLYVATNGIQEVQEKRLEVAGLKKYFKGVFASSKIGFCKPNKEFFEQINEIIRANKNEMIIVGDRYDSDILGGINFGIDQILIGNGKATYVANSLIDLLDILEA